MELQVEVMSSEMIKPSTPTPNHLNNYKLSLFDQFFQFTYVPHILFYKPPLLSHKHGYTTQMTTIARLQESLSQSLSLFYPFAGRLTSDESAIECNEKGVSFVVARVLDCSIVSFLEATNRVDLVSHFLSKNIYDHTITSDNATDNDNNNNISRSLDVTKLVPLTIQVTIFDCGGVVIGSQWLHKVCDGVTWGNFLKTWASFAAKRNEDVVIQDFETGISLFPPRNRTIQPAERKVRTLWSLDANEATKVDDGLCIVKPFVFSSEAISALQTKGTSDDVPNPTRIEAVSGFIWKHAMSATAATNTSSSSSTMLGPSALTHAMNIRPRFHPPLPSTTFGNIFIDTIAYYEGNIRVGETDPNLQDLVHRIRKSLSMAKDAEYINKFQGDEGGDVLCNYKQKLTDILTNSNVTTYKFTSWGRLDMNPDFGFGLPSWTGFTGGKLSSGFKNLVILIENCNGVIEAWLILDEQEMVLLQDDEDFLEFASPSAWKLS